MDGEFTITLFHEPAEPLPPPKKDGDDKKGRRQQGSPMGRRGKVEAAPPPGIGGTIRTLGEGEGEGFRG